MLSFHSVQSWYNLAKWPVSQDYIAFRDEAADGNRFAVLPLNVWRPTPGEHTRVHPLGQQAATRGALVKITFTLRHYHIKDFDSFVAEISEIFILRCVRALLLPQNYGSQTISLGLPRDVSPRKRALTQEPTRPAPWTPTRASRFENITYKRSVLCGILAASRTD